MIAALGHRAAGIRTAWLLAAAALVVETASCATAVRAQEPAVLPPMPQFDLPPSAVPVFKLASSVTAAVGEDAAAVASTIPQVVGQLQVCYRFREGIHEHDLGPRRAQPAGSGPGAGRGREARIS